MIHDYLANKVFRNLSHLSLSPTIIDRCYNFEDTLKQCLLNNIGDASITVESTSELLIEIKTEELKTALFSDFYFGHIRIKEQINNVNNLINADSQVAWTVTTVYYACYFMAVEIAKLYGEFIINFSKDEFDNIINSSNNPNNFTINSNTSFKVIIQLSDYDNFIKLHLSKCGTKPHKIVWINLYGIINRLDIDDSLLHHKNLLKSICDQNNNSWKFPSDVRNEWNYTYANYYSDKGTEIGDTFLSIIKESDLAMNWASLRTIQPNEKNVTASIAYLYHCLHGTIENIASRLYQ